MQELPGLKRIAGLALEYMGVDELAQTITICGGCYDSLLDNKRPEFAVANGFLFGPVPECLRDLTFVEWRCIQRNRVSVIVEQLRSNDSVSERSHPHQLKLKSHVLAFLQVR